MNTRERLTHLAACSALFEPWTGSFDKESLLEWLEAELGDPAALDRPVPHGPLRSQALAAPRLLHVVSENTAHAAFQSLLRGLVVGSHNTVKLPSAGLPGFAEAVAALPRELASLVTLLPDLPPAWRTQFDALVVFGTDETLEWFARNTPARVRFLPHGQKLSIALVSGDAETAARLAARDVSRFDQRGCLSLHDVYLTPEAGLRVPDFAALLASEMERFEEHSPRAKLNVEEAASISALREDRRFQAATHPARCALWESEGSTAWTVIYEASPELKISPLNRVVFVKPWPASASTVTAREALGEETRHLSTLALHPFVPARAAEFVALGATRLCPLGETQNPSLFWHHDGLPPLASLTSWVDVG